MLEKCKKCGYKNRPKSIFPCNECIEKNEPKAPLTCDSCRNSWYCEKRGKNQRRLRICDEFEWN